LASTKQEVFILGPTATGKTELAMDCLRNFPLEIISVDSAQIYRHFDIGSAKLSRDDQIEYPHRLIDIIDPNQTYSAAQFINDYKKHKNEIYANGNSPLLVGGTMMYFNAIFNPMNDLPASTPESRAYVNNLLLEEGLQTLYEKLSNVDPVYVKKINASDTQRILRALEVFHLSGHPITFFHKNHTQPKENKGILKLALLPNDRVRLHERIALRVDRMLDDNFIEEVKNILKLYPDLDNTYPSIRCVGYKQIFLYLKNEITKTDLKDKIIFATRQLAKRQITWLRQMQQLEVIDPFDKNIKNIIKNKVARFLDYK